MFGFVTARPRLFASLVVMLVAYPLAPHTWLARTRLLCAWDLGVVVYLVLTAILFCSEHLDQIAANAERQQEGEWTIFGITVAVVAASFVAIFGEFGDVKDMHAAVKDAHIALIALTLFASWIMLHATFCYRYAHEFYTVSGPGPAFDRGLDFPDEKNPDYLDFTYFAIVLGMTFQVSDVQITSRKFRRLAALHGLLSFLFNTVIVALTVNIGASLL
jgi:uncharacterized membrane protein